MTPKASERQGDEVPLVTTPQWRVSIFHYRAEEHQFDSTIHIEPAEPLKLDSSETTLSQPIIQPSQEWMDEYNRWNIYGNDKSVPVFESREDLHEFNAKGKELCERLQEELERTHHDDHNDNITVQPFLPIYSNVTVGDAVWAWWHVKDVNYGLVIPIQKLPISDRLKSRFQAWRFQKLTGWLEPSIRDKRNSEGHDLQENLLQELHEAEPFESNNNSFSSIDAEKRLEAAAMCLTELALEAGTLIGIDKHKTVDKLPSPIVQRPTFDSKLNLCDQ